MALLMGLFLSTEVGRQAAVDQSVSAMEGWGRTVDDTGYAAIERQAAMAKYINPVAILVMSPLITALLAGLAYGIFTARSASAPVRRAANSIRSARGPSA